jgi:SSS family solute:Na+ symporter
MTTEFGFIDYLVFTAYAVLILGVGLWVSREKRRSPKKNAEDYFLASHCLGGLSVLH